MKITKRTKAATRRAIKLLGGVQKAATETGIDKGTISRCNNGKRAPPLKLAIALSNATGGRVPAVEMRPELGALAPEQP